MTLVLKTLSHPSSVNLSVPCDVVNYTALTVYESAVKRQKKLDEESADHFIITEKGMSVEVSHRMNARNLQIIIMKKSHEFVLSSLFF